MITGFDLVDGGKYVRRDGSASMNAHEMAIRMFCGDMSDTHVSTEYEIRAGKHAPCELWSVVTKHGKTYKNYVAEGTHTHCTNIQAQLTGYA